MLALVAMQQMLMANPAWNNQILRVRAWCHLGTGHHVRAGHVRVMRFHSTGRGGRDGRYWNALMISLHVMLQSLPTCEGLSTHLTGKWLHLKIMIEREILQDFVSFSCLGF
jgi:hypothetical protein